MSANRRPFIQNGQVDIVVATYTINDTRKQLVDFAGPYYMAGQDIMVAEGNPDGIEGPTTWPARTSAPSRARPPSRTSGTTTPRPTLTLFDVYSKCADALAAGQVDAVTTDNVILPASWPAVDGAFELVGNPFTEEPYGIGLTKGDDDFRDFINDVLEEAFEDGSWAEAWDRTAGAISGTEAPEPPTVDRY